MKYIHRMIMCEPKKIHYDYESEQMFLYVAEGHCCDMKGAITLAQMLDENVKCVRTYSGSEADTMYVCFGGEEDTWMAFHPMDGEIYNILMNSKTPHLHKVIFKEKEN